MKLELNILHLEDDDDDAYLIAAALRRHGLTCQVEQVKTREDFVTALEHPAIDLILSDFSLPSFDGLSALELARGKRPDVPFVFVSGTIGEEVAINALQCGASDYVFKHRLPRLGPAVQRAIADAEKQRELQRTERAMIQSEHKYRQLFECLSEAVLLAEVKTGRIVDTNRQAEMLLGLTRAEILGRNIDRVLPPATLADYRRQLIVPEASPDRVVFEGEIIPKEGKPIPVAISAALILVYDRRLVVGLYRDITDRRQMMTEMQQLKEQLHTLQKRTAPNAGA